MPLRVFFHERFLAAIYILVTAIGTLSLFSKLPVALKAAYVPFVIMAALLFAMGYARKRAKVSLAYLKAYLLYILLMFAMTSVIYGVQSADGGHMLRGYEKLAFQTLTVLISVEAFYLFGRNAVNYTFYGFVLFYVISVVLALLRTGFAAAWSSILQFIVSPDYAEGFMKLLELHDAVFALGVFLIYFLLDGVKKNRLRFLVAVFFFLIGFKRIGFLAVAAALLFFLLLRKRPNTIYQTSLILGALIMLGGFAYIVLIKHHVFSFIMERLGINAMGREDLYEFINDYYEISVSYIGKGFEYITLLMKTTKKVGYLNLTHIQALHNGFLTVYIEFGFWGYFLWTGFWLLWFPVWTKQFGSKALLAQLLVSVYLFITYATDNTAFYFSTGIAARLMPMVFAWEGGKNEAGICGDDLI